MAQVTIDGAVHEVEQGVADFIAALEKKASDAETAVESVKAELTTQLEEEAKKVLELEKRAADAEDALKAKIEETDQAITAGWRDIEARVAQDFHRGIREIFNLVRQGDHFAAGIVKNAESFLIGLFNHLKHPAHMDPRNSST